VTFKNDPSAQLLQFKWLRIGNLTAVMLFAVWFGQSAGGIFSLFWAGT